MVVKVAITKGKIKAISISKDRGTRKYNVPMAELKADFGIESDAHAGSRQRLRAVARPPPRPARTPGAQTVGMLFGTLPKTQ